jgi:RNA-directed DNA polymerase
MSREVHVRFCESRAVRFRPATHLVALCHSQRQAEQIKARLAEWLAPRGLVFNEDKTRIVHLTTGFDFLGFSVRRYGGTLLIKPSKAAIQRIRERLRTEMRALRGSNAAAVLAALTPIIRGWAAYYRGVVSSKTFKSLDNYLWTLTYKWATRGHPNKPKTWVAARYFGRFNKFRNDHWVFGDAASGAYLVKFSWTDIVRHTLVTGTASPDDPALAEYWAARRRRIKPPLDGYTLRLLAKQNGRCPFCGDELLCAEQPPQSPHEWERWWLQITRKAIVADYLVHHGRSGPPGKNTTRLAHASCRREHQTRQGRNPAATPRTATRLA